MPYISTDTISNKQSLLLVPLTIPFVILAFLLCISYLIILALIWFIRILITLVLVGHLSLGSSFVDKGTTLRDYEPSAFEQVVFFKKEQNKEIDD